MTGDEADGQLHEADPGRTDDSVVKKEAVKTPSPRNKEHHARRRSENDGDERPSKLTDTSPHQTLDPATGNGINDPAVAIPHQTKRRGDDLEGEGQGKRARLDNPSMPDADPQDDDHDSSEQGSTDTGS